jgi:hypothetical protein
MNELFVTILGGKYLTNGKIIKTASPHTLNPNPIAQVVIGGHVGYHLLQKGKKVFYSIELIEELYKQNLPIEQKKTFLSWKNITIILITMIIVMSVTTINISFTYE